MKTLLGIIASPRKLGNSELFVRELRAQLSGFWELKLMRLPELDIRPCRGCYRCIIGEKVCPLKDDFHLVMESLIQSDAYVVAAPTYFLGAHATLKGVLDRGLSFYDHVDELWGKPAVGVAIAGNEGREGYTKLAVESFIKLTMGDLRGSAVLYGALPGEIFIGNEGKETAKRLAQALICGEETNTDVPACPLCGGDTFRFLPNSQVRCMLCSNTGYYECEENRLQCHIVVGEHPWFLSYESSKRHNDLLREKKEDFIGRREELKAITQQDTQEVTWIRSERDQSKK